jgi:hypothetical protein
MKNILLVFVSVFGCLLMSGCATTTTIKLDPAKMEYVLVYPLNDVRETKSIDVSECGGNYIHQPVGDYYMAKNFDAIVRYAQLTGIQPNITYEDLTNRNTERLKIANNGGENYIMVLYLSELQFSGGNTTFTTSMEGFLFRVDTGQVVWQDSAKNTRWLGILGGQLDRLTGTVGNSNACQVYGEVLANMLRKFPKLTKRVHTVSQIAGGAVE